MKGILDILKQLCSNFSKIADRYSERAEKLETEIIHGIHRYSMQDVSYNNGKAAGYSSASVALNSLIKEIEDEIKRDSCRTGYDTGLFPNFDVVNDETDADNNTRVVRSTRTANLSTEGINITITGI